MLQSAYMRSVSGSSELVLISGAAGSGKSTLAIHFSQYITSNKGVYLCGKYDQYNQSRPFSALASAFDEYCLCLSREDESERAKTVADKLQMTFGQEDLYHLIQLIPNLALIFPGKDDDEENSYQDCENAQKRLNFLFCSFVEVSGKVWRDLWQCVLAV